MFCRYAIAGDGDKSPIDILTDDRINCPEDQTQDDDMQHSIVVWHRTVKSQKREVLARRFGLMGYEPATLEEVGEEIGLTRERVRQSSGRFTPYERDADATKVYLSKLCSSLKSCFVA